MAGVPVGMREQLTSAIFFQALTLRLSALLPFELRGFEHRRQGRLTKFHYGHSSTHFETAHHPGSGRMEIGLHFEGDAELNQAAFDFFRSRMVEIKGALPEAELEPWDRGWSRLYETIPGPGLSSHLADTTATRLAAQITTLQPLLNEFWRTHGAS